MQAAAFNKDHRIDPYSPTWLVVEHRIRADIEKIRNELEYDHEPGRTANLRGQLTALRSMLQLGVDGSVKTTVA